MVPFSIFLLVLYFIWLAYLAGKEEQREDEEFEREWEKEHKDDFDDY